jgi:hypothetical protein
MYGWLPACYTAGCGVVRGAISTSPITKQGGPRIVLRDSIFNHSAAVAVAVAIAAAAGLLLGLLGMLVIVIPFPFLFLTSDCLASCLLLLPFLLLLFQFPEFFF